MDNYTISFNGHQAQIKPQLVTSIANQLYDELSYAPTGVEFSPNHISNRWIYRNGKRVYNARANWDGKVRLFKQLKRPTDIQMFPSGLLLKALHHLGSIKDQVVLNDLVPVTQPAPRTLDGLTLPLKGKLAKLVFGAHQHAVVTALLDAPFGRGMAESPTGSGKTLMTAEICYKFPKHTVLITVPSKSLLYQTSSDLSDLLGEEVGLYGDGLATFKRVTVAIINSLQEGAKKPHITTYLKSVQIWIVDESHLSAADSYRYVSAFLPNTQRRIGLSATLHREDGAELEFHGLIGPKVVTIPPMDLVDSNWLARPIIEMHIIEHNNGERGFKKPPFDAVYKSQVVNNTIRNDAIFMHATRCQTEGLLPCMILVKDIKHGEILHELISNLGPTAYLYGDDSQQVRQDVIEQLQAGKIQFLVASSIFDVGIDIPELRAIILAGAGKSASRAIQRVGRGLRRAPSKTTALIIDFEDREANFLHGHSMERRGWYEAYYPGCVTTWRDRTQLKDVPW